MIDAVLSNPTLRMLEQTVNFTEQRHAVLVADIANADTPGYVQQDLPVAAFQSALRDAIKRERESVNGDFAPRSDDGITFDAGSSAVSTESRPAVNSVVFHDRGVRQMEFLMSQLADNALAHNTAAQFLKNRYDQIAKAISMKV